MPYVTRQRYLPDFIDTPSKRIVEAKGRSPASDRTKMKTVRKQYPDYAITIIFQKPDAPLNKDSKTTNAMWCEQHGIQWQRLRAEPIPGIASIPRSPRKATAGAR
ncbi:endodeoxyribonuclease [Ensifer sp. ENS04]|nr:endodeoxyribonuclease [Ensifer sp. ENS04]